ncbi:MAG: PKD domain-containing protein [Candidatus Thermoplasmatota archaeon]|nr:PKD domain-containing protein [Candidatus Thermoplasmatota archaeon]
MSKGIQPLVAIIIVFALIMGLIGIGLLMFPGEQQEDHDAAIKPAIAIPTRIPHAGEEIWLNGASSSARDMLGLSYFWDFGDGKTARGVNVTHSYNEAGSKTITLKVEDRKGSHNSTSLLIVVQSGYSQTAPRPIFTSPAKTPSRPYGVMVSREAFVTVRDMNYGNIQEAYVEYAGADGEWHPAGNGHALQTFSRSTSISGSGLWSTTGGSQWSLLWNLSSLPDGEYLLKTNMTYSSGQTSIGGMVVQNVQLPPIPAFQDFHFFKEVNGTFVLGAETSCPDAVGAQFYQMSPTAGSHAGGWAVEQMGNVSSTMVGPSIGGERSNFCGPASAANVLLSLASRDQSILLVPGSETEAYVGLFHEHRAEMGGTGEYYASGEDGEMALTPLGLSVILSNNMGTDSMGGTTDQQMENGIRHFFVQQGQETKYVVGSSGPANAHGANSSENYGALTGPNAGAHKEALRRDGMVLFLMSEISPGDDFLYGTPLDKISPGTGRWVALEEYSTRAMPPFLEGSLQLEESLILAHPGGDGLHPAPTRITAKAEEIRYFRDGAYHNHLYLRVGETRYVVQHMTTISSPPSQASPPYSGYVLKGLNQTGEPLEEGGWLFNHSFNSAELSDGLWGYGCMMTDSRGNQGWEEVWLYVNNNIPDPVLSISGAPSETMVLEIEARLGTQDLAAMEARYWNSTSSSWTQIGIDNRWEGCFSLQFNTSHIQDETITLEVDVYDLSSSKILRTKTIDMPTVQMTFSGNFGAWENVTYITENTYIVFETNAHGLDATGETYYRMKHDGVWSDYELYTETFNITLGEGIVIVEYYTLWSNGYVTSTRNHTLYNYPLPPEFVILEPLENQSLEDAQQIVVFLSANAPEPAILQLSCSFRQKEQAGNQSTFIASGSFEGMWGNVTWDATAILPGEYWLDISVSDILGRVVQKQIAVEKA